MATPNQTCCPQGYTYVDNNGYYYDNTGTLTLVLNNTTTIPTLADVSSKCVEFTNKGFAQNPQAPEDCPCCPDGYFYSQLSGGCCPGNTSTGICNAVYLVPTIPCIPCNCEEPPAPRECVDCSTELHHISFSLITNQKACTDCDPIGEPRPLPAKYAKGNAFLPYTLIDPIINFTRN